jgi:hypothetical protein
MLLDNRSASFIYLSLNAVTGQAFTAFKYIKTGKTVSLGNRIRVLASKLHFTDIIIWKKKPLIHETPSSQLN